MQMVLESVTDYLQDEDHIDRITTQMEYQVEQVHLKRNESSLIQGSKEPRQVIFRTFRLGYLRTHARRVCGDDRD